MDYYFLCIYYIYCCETFWKKIIVDIMYVIAATNNHKQRQMQMQSIYL